LAHTALIEIEYKYESAATGQPTGGSSDVITAKFVRTWYKIHKWSSLICTAFILVSAITGLPLIFGDEIDSLMRNRITMVPEPGGSAAITLEKITEETKGLYPGQTILFLAWDFDEPRIFVTIAPHQDSHAESRRTIVFNSHSGELMQESSAVSDLMTAIAKLHITLYAGLSGELLLGLMAFLFVLALVSGFVVYGPFMRAIGFGTVRRTGTVRLKWFDLHNLLGIVTFGWASVVGVTGLMNTLSPTLFDLWRARELPRLLEPYRGKALPAKSVSLDAAVAEAQRALPENQLTSVVFPNRSLVAQDIS
jgi:uncharacterized iron-regulated membrane protein